MRGHSGERAGGEDRMDLILLIPAGIAAAVLAVRAAAVKDGFLRAAVNGLLGLAALLLVLTNWVPKVKGLHPIVFIALSAAVGIVFGFAGA